MSRAVEQNTGEATQLGRSTEPTIVHEAPFTKCDREEDYERAWRVFEGRKAS
jgi:hypothetical protein